MIIVITGIPRAGTSAVAGVLHKMGCCMGTRFGEPDQKINPRGFFEDLDFVDMHSHIPNIGAGVEHWFNLRSVGRYNLSEQYKLLISLRAQYPVWGVKDLRMMHFFDQFVGAVGDEELRVIEVWRTPKAVIKSFDTYLKGKVAPKRLLSVYSDWFDLLMATWEIIGNNNLPLLPVVYDTLLSRPEETVATIADFVGVQPTNAAIAHIDRRLNRSGR